jgi:hypothetical protein
VKVESKKQAKIQVTVSQAEYAEIHRSAAKAGMTASQMLRRRAGLPLAKRGRPANPPKIRH